MKDLLISKNDELSRVIRSLDGDAMIQLSDGNILSSSDVAELQERINVNRKICDNFKREVKETQKSLSDLYRTEDAIKNQQLGIVTHHQKEERIAGVTKFHDINNKLVATSKETASLNVLKTKTLEDISAMVQEISHKLEGKQHELKPKVRQLMISFSLQLFSPLKLHLLVHQIEELKKKRSQFQELQKRHARDEANYYEALLTLTNDNKDLENDCSRLRQEWREKQSSSQFLSMADKMKSISQLHMDLEKESLLQQQRRLSEYISHQRDMFANLKKLLDFKSKVTGDSLAGI